LWSIHRDRTENIVFKEQWSMIVGNQWNCNYKGKMKYSEENSPIYTFSTNPTWNRLGLTSGPQCERSASDRLSHNMKSSGPVHCHDQNKLMNFGINKFDLNIFPKFLNFHFNSDSFNAFKHLQNSRNRFVMATCLSVCHG
jgi:hypothetical protein